MNLKILLRAMTARPAELLGLATGRLAKDSVADIIVFDPSEPWIVNRDQLQSRSKNSPFDESKMQGRVLHTMVAGQSVYKYPPQ